MLQIGRSLVRFHMVSLEFFIDIKSFRSYYGPGVDSAHNRNEYQEYFLGVKSGRCVRLTTLPPSRAIVTVHVRVLVEKVAMAQGFHDVLRFSQVNIIPSASYTHSFVILVIRSQQLPQHLANNTLKKGRKCKYGVILSLQAPNYYL